MKPYYELYYNLYNYMEDIEDLKEKYDIEEPEEEY